MQKVFYRPYNSYEGIGARLYRSCWEIKDDINEIRRKIDSAMERLNVRSILTDALSRYAESEPAVWVPELEALVREADETLDELNELRETLDILKEELEDTRWAVGI